jgi:hypothetical protein
MSVKDYKKLSSPKKSFLDFINESSFKGAELEIFRDTSLTRDIEL